uniref:1,4-alpha-glucan branching enzyme GlgB n=1 Tax=Candidatus Kentrum sp. FW TaxID=2126338 RepID=A0A450S107_9GAMM|nr:MAG: 1,4-alpha-glucan branching enzyme [Candidatus Kentron sp. FW]
MTRNTKADSTGEFEVGKGKKAAAPKAPTPPEATGTNPPLKTQKEPSENKTGAKSTAGVVAPKASSKATPKVASKAPTPSGTIGTNPSLKTREEPPENKAGAKSTTRVVTPKASSKVAPEASSGTAKTKPSPGIRGKISSPIGGKTDRQSTVIATDRKPLGSGIDAMSLLTSPKDGKDGDKDRSRGSRPGGGGAHRSAAEVIAKATSRDHSKPGTVRKSKGSKVTAKTVKPSQSAPKPTKSEPKAKSRLTPKVPIPPEPKGPIGGIDLGKPTSPLIKEETIAAILNADHPAPFSFFGMHELDSAGGIIIRVFFPEASSVKVLDVANKAVATLKKVHDEGLFAGEISGHTRPFPYRLRVTTPSGETDIDDPYRFPPILSDKDVEELAKGQSFTIYKQLGAHPTEIDGVAGVVFAVWAPNASHVSVVGDFNAWDGRRHGMRFHQDCGVWEIFLPGATTGSLYKYEIKHAPGTVPEVKSDPCAFHTELPLGTASIVYGDGTTFRWQDKDWMKNRRTRNPDKPLSLYEVHLGSWRRKPEEDNRWLSYREMADDLVDYCTDMGFTHIALLPISEHIYDDTVGYLPSNLYAPTNRYGTPDDFRYFVDACHRAGIGIVVDWVPNYFTEEEHGLSLFDGTALYEHHHAWQGRDPDWNAPLYDLTRGEVVSYLISNALYWLDYFHLDGLRIGGLAKMLYLDYGRSEGDWTPNADGGNENLDALAFIRRLNDLVAKEYPGVMMIAEDSSLRGDLTKPVSEGGLGFSWRWNTAWVYDTLRYLGRHPVYRKYYQFELTNPLSYAFDERFILPVSHDHVSIGQGAVPNKIPGDYWQKFATLRAWYALMYTLPNKKLLFMGTEFAQDREWNSNISLDWHLLDSQVHLGTQGLIRDLNNLYLKKTALHECDSDAGGFEWIDTADDDSSVISFLRFSKDRAKFMVVVTHITPVVRPNYRIGVPQPGRYREVLNTDAEIYGGGNQGSAGGATAEQHWAHGREYSICVTLPPYATVVLELEEEDKKPEKETKEPE